MQIYRETEFRNMFVRTSILLHRFSKCFLSVVLRQLCLSLTVICMYDVALWKFFKKGSIDRFYSCYNKCVKAFLAINVMTAWGKCWWKLVFQALIPQLINNCKYVFEMRWFALCSMLVSTFRSSSWRFIECVTCYCVSFFFLCVCVSLSVVRLVGQVPEIKWIDWLIDRSIDRSIRSFVRSFVHSLTDIPANCFHCCWHCVVNYVNK